MAVLPPFPRGGGCMFDESTLQRLYRYAFALTGSEADAYDLLQDTVERYLAHDTGRVDSPERYAWRIMRNRFVDGQRQQRRERELFALSQASTEPAFDDLQIAHRAELEMVWSLLDPTDRELLLLSVVEGYSAREIGDRLGCPRGTILARLHRVRAKVERRLAEAHGAATAEVQSS